MKILFLLLQLAAGLASLIGLSVLAWIVTLQSAATFAKESLVNLWGIVSMFASAFQKSTPIAALTGLDIHGFQVLLGVLFPSMLVSVFTPGAKNFLHGVAVLAAIAVGWCEWITATSTRTETIYVPFVGVWFFYYLVCIFRVRWELSTFAR